MLTLLLFTACSASAADPAWVRDWERAQEQRPRAIERVGRLAPAGEPGTPLVVHGRVVGSDGVTPAGGVIVFAYQTDARGLYNEPGKRGWRLRGWARTDAAGRFELRTIRPASYPRSRVPAHIHVTIDAPALQRRWVEEIHFADDPFLPKTEKGLSVTTRAGVQHVDYLIRVLNDGKF